MSEIVAGTKLYSVATGMVDVFKRRSRAAVKLMGEQDGFLAVHPDYGRGACLWLYASENDAIRARNVAKAHGVECGENIGRFTMAADGAMEADADWFAEKLAGGAR